MEQNYVTATICRPIYGVLMHSIHGKGQIWGSVLCSIEKQSRKHNNWARLSHYMAMADHVLPLALIGQIISAVICAFMYAVDAEFAQYDTIWKADLTCARKLT